MNSEKTDIVRALNEQIVVAQHHLNEEIEVHAQEMSHANSKIAQLELSITDKEAQMEEARVYLSQLEEQLADQREHDAKLNAEILVLRNERVAFAKRTQEIIASSHELRAQLEMQKTESRIELRNLRLEAEQSLNRSASGIKSEIAKRISSEVRNRFGRESQASGAP